MGGYKHEHGSFACVYVCTHVHTYRRTNIHTYKHTDIHTYTYKYIHDYIHTETRNPKGTVANLGFIEWVDPLPGWPGLKENTPLRCSNRFHIRLGVVLPCSEEMESKPQRKAEHSLSNTWPWGPPWKSTICRPERRARMTEERYPRMAFPRPNLGRMMKTRRRKRSSLVTRGALVGEENGFWRGGLMESNERGW